ncbi:MAG: AhpC/TSA family protein [Hyphomicrobiales bacterium]|nr:AhpC/TSA family protein [Hyphomicrobiales bacterium]MCP5374049.1 AhpC/TSA family protein [Hyphomicrobiales bacterium]
MNLKDELAQQRARGAQRFSDEARAEMMAATKRLAESGLAERAVGVGHTAPRFALPDALGTTVALDDLLAKGPVVMTFYRGTWCPYCNLEVRAFQEVLPQIEDAGASLVAISPQTPDNSLTLVEKHGLGFHVLSDAGNATARDYGLVFVIDNGLRKVYQDKGLDIPGHNGDGSWELPIPATYVIGRDGKVAYAFVDADYTARAEPAEVVDALRALSGAEAAE